MDQLIASLRFVHIAFGFLGLASFWLPLFVHKGGTLHRRVGWVFVGAMSFASITAAVLSMLRLVQLKNSSQALTLETASGSLFLLNVALLTFASVYHGVQVLRQKKRTGPVGLQPPGAFHLLLPALLFAFSLAMVGVGIVLRSPVLLTLPVVGLFVSWQQLWCTLRAPQSNMFWWFQHMAGMFGGCIAALTAALITNSRTVAHFAPLPEWAFWIAPSALGVPVLLVWQRMYRKKFAGARREQ
jgi:hypothetical protein